MNSQNSKSKKKMTKADWIGAIVGFFIAGIILQMGSFGFMSAFIIAYGSYWIVKKIAQLFLKEGSKKFCEPVQKDGNKYKQEIIQNEEKNITPKKFKKKLIWVCIIVIFIIIIFSELPNQQDVELTKTDKNDSYSEQSGNLYRNIKYDFRIKFPEGWEIKSGDGPNILRKAVNNNHMISVGVREIPIEYLDKKATIKNVMGLIEFKDTLLNDMQEKFPDSKLIDYGESKLDNKPVYWIKYFAPYTVLNTTVEGILLQYQVLNNNIFYFITAGSTSEEFDSVEATLKKSISTFVIEDY